jgi:hypothetical protein
MMAVTLTSTTNMIRKGELYIESGIIKLSDGTFTHVLHEKAFNCEIKEEVNEGAVTYCEDTKTNRPISEAKASIARNVGPKSKKKKA